MVINTKRSGNYSQDSSKKFLLVVLLVALTCTSSVALALPVVNLTLDDGEMDEAGLGTGKFTVTRSSDEPIDQPLQVFFTFGGTASNGSDYTAPDQGYAGPIHRQMTIPANETSISSTITPIKDNLVESAETLIWTLYSDQSTYNLGADVLAEMSIVDDPVEVILTLDDGEMDEAALGTGKFTVTRSSNGKPDAALPIFFTFGGTASNGSDYTAPDQGYAGPIHRQMTIPANETSISSTITPIKDNLVESAETLIWTLYSDQSTYNLGADVLAEMSIVDDPVEVILTLDDGEMDEAALGTGKFTVTRSSNGKPDAALPIFFTFGGTASNGSDYTAPDQGYAGPIHRQMTIPANETSISSTITPIKDNLVESAETLIWTLYSDQSTYNLGADVLAEMSIVDDPVEVILTLDDGEMDEAALGTGKFTVTRSSNGKPDAALPIFFTFGGTASNGSDYTAPDQGYAGPIHRQMTIPANANSVSSIITPIRDLVIEGDETVTWTLYSDQATYNLGTDIFAEMTIADLVDFVFKDSFEDEEP